MKLKQKILNYKKLYNITSRWLLAYHLGVSEFTLVKILNGDTSKIRPNTIETIERNLIK